MEADGSAPSLAVEGWMAAAGISAAAVSRRAGVSPSTVHRVLTGQVDPSYGTLREIAIACGVDLPLAAVPLADPGAARAARTLLEPGYDDATGADARWVARLRRQAGDDPVALVAAAGAASAPARRDGTALWAGPATTARVASAGEAAGGPWGLSGAAGLTLPIPWEPLPAPSLLWCTDTARVRSLLAGDGDLEQVTDPDRATLVAAEADATLFTNAFSRDGIRYASPLQIAIDCTSLGGAVALAAREEMLSW